MDTYASERVSQNSFCPYWVCIIHAVVLTSHENRSFSFQTFLHFFLKIHHKIFNSSKLVNLFLSEGGPSLAHSKIINFIGRECPNLEGDGWKYRDIMEKCQFFPKAPPISLIFLWVVIHFIAVIYCILMYQSIPSLAIPRATPGDSSIVVAPGVGFSLLCLARGSAPRGVLNQTKSSIILKKKRDFRFVS